MDKIYYVYVHTLRSDGRKYFGITSQKPEDRWRNGEGYKGSTHIYHAIQKYGWNAFDHDILHECKTLKEAYNYEEKYIAEYNTTNENFGFNLQSGGERPKQCRESIKKTADKQRGRKRTGDLLRRYQEHARAIGKARTGIPRSEETKHKISESHKGMTYGEKTKQKLREAFSQPVLCVELNQVFPSMTAAAEHFCLSKCTISAVIKGRNKTAAGYHWKLLP